MSRIPNTGSAFERVLGRHLILKLNFSAKFFYLLQLRTGDPPPLRWCCSPRPAGWRCPALSRDRKWFRIELTHFRPGRHLQLIFPAKLLYLLLLRRADPPPRRWCCCSPRPAGWRCPALSRDRKWFRTGSARFRPGSTRSSLCQEEEERMKYSRKNS